MCRVASRRGRIDREIVVPRVCEESGEKQWAGSNIVGERKGRLKEYKGCVRCETQLRRGNTV